MGVVQRSSNCTASVARYSLLTSPGGRWHLLGGGAQLTSHRRRSGASACGPRGVSAAYGREQGGMVEVLGVRVRVMGVGEQQGGTKQAGNHPETEHS